MTDDGQDVGSGQVTTAMPDSQPVESVAMGLSSKGAGLLISATAFVLLLATMFVVPARFALLAPGPALNTLGSQDGKPLIDVEGRQTYPATGALDLTTVTVYGGPGGTVSPVDVVLGWFNRHEAVVPVEDVFPPDETAQQTKAQNAHDMTSSQQEATAAALSLLGISYTSVLRVDGVDPSAPAATVLRTGDRFVAINGTPVTDDATLRTLIHAAGIGRTLHLTLKRDGREVSVDAVTRRGSDGQAQLGIDVGADFVFPFQVKFQIEDIGGPSAGTMFALGIIDKLTPGSLTGGRNIAGTGTMDSSGAVGAIGGIREKMVGAQDAGATWFLAPKDNCNEVVGHIPDGLKVVAISTLSGARDAVTTIASGKNTASLPTCH